MDEKITVQLQNNNEPYIDIFSCLQLHQNRYFSIAAVMSCKPILIFVFIGYSQSELEKKKTIIFFGQTLLVQNI